MNSVISANRCKCSEANSTINSAISKLIERVVALETTNKTLTTKVEQLETTLNDVYERTKNYNMGYLLFEDEGIHATSLYDFTKLVNPDLVVKTDSLTDIEWTETAESIMPSTIQTMTEALYSTGLQRTKTMKETLYDVFDRTRNYNEGKVLFGQGDDVVGIHLKHLADAVNNKLCKVVETDTSNWFVIEEDSTLDENSQTLYQRINLDIYNNAKSDRDELQTQIDNLETSLNNKLDKELSEPIIFDWLNASGSPYDEDNAELTNVVEILKRISSDITYGSQYIELAAAKIPYLIEEKNTTNSNIVKLETRFQGNIDAIGEHLEDLEERLDDVYYRTKNYNLGSILVLGVDDDSGEQYNVGFNIYNVARSIDEQLIYSLELETPTGKWSDIGLYKNGTNEACETIRKQIAQNAIQTSSQTIQTQIDNLTITNG